MELLCDHPHILSQQLRITRIMLIKMLLFEDSYDILIMVICCLDHFTIIYLKQLSIFALIITSLVLPPYLCYLVVCK